MKRMKERTSMKSAHTPFGDRHVYRELAKLTQNRRLRMVYAKMHARAYKREMAAAGTATV